MTPLCARCGHPRGWHTPACEWLGPAVCGCPAYVAADDAP